MILLKIWLFSNHYPSKTFMHKQWNLIIILDLKKSDTSSSWQLQEASQTTSKILEELEKIEYFKSESTQVLSWIKRAAEIKIELAYISSIRGQLAESRRLLEKIQQSLSIWEQELEVAIERAEVAEKKVKSANEISLLTNLKKLLLNDNKISVIPNEISLLTNLKIFNSWK